MLELRKKGNKHWLFIDNEIGEFTPSKFTINRLNNVITIVYFNNLKSKDYNVSDCYIFDIGDISGFNTSDGVAFMDKLEELNCPCFQKDVTNIYGGGSVESVNGQTGDVILGFSDITTAQNLGEFIDGLDSKTDIKDDDEFILSDSEDSLKSKKNRFLDLKTKLKSYVDTFYLSLSIFNDFVEHVFNTLDNKLDKSTTASSVYGTNTAGGQTMIPFSTLQPTLGFTPENVANKATNLTSPDDTKYPTTLAVSTELATKQNTLTNPITGTGTINRVSKFTSSGNIGDSQIFDNGTNVGIATTSPQARLDVRAQGALATDIAFRVRNSTDTQNFLVVNGAGDVYNNGASGFNTNTFFGEFAGRSATGGSNTAIGRSALQNNTTGGDNTAIGRSALQNNTTGSSNTAIGLNALLTNTTGSLNTAIGLNALRRNTTGGDNTAIGRSALDNNTTGGSNTAIGQAAGSLISDGSNNTTTNNSIFIGYDTRALADNQTNQIVIGYQAIGLGSNSVVLGNTSITRTQLRGQVIMGSFASAPTGIEGAIYYDSTTKKHRGFNGTAWNDLY